MNLIVILGPTATGKTKLATLVADHIDAEIIGADSRQVYKGMDIGTGKDLSDYEIRGCKIRHHLIDIVPAGNKYNLNDYQRDFKKTFRHISSKNKQVILVGGTGMYIEAVLHNYSRTPVPLNNDLRSTMEHLETEELIRHLKSINKSNTTFDTSTRKRLIRAIEICHYGRNKDVSLPAEEACIDYQIFGIKLKRDLILERIWNRLLFRLENGMIEEVKGLLNSGIPTDDLKYYGLEYKIITEYLEGQYTYDDMVQKLNIRIRQYAKRQMTWFRRMEKNGFEIEWIDGELPLNDQVRHILKSNI